FVDAVLARTERLARELDGAPPVLVGTIARAVNPPPHHPGLLNVAALLQGGAIAGARSKSLLPTYDVFHEERWFLPATERAPLSINGHRFGVLICEDLWSQGYAIDPARELVAGGA